MKKFISIYKINLLIALTLSITLTALSVIKDPVLIALTFICSILGTFILDLDYFIHAYLVEPEETFSKNLRAFIKHKDLSGALTHIQVNGDTVKDKTLHSALFQLLFAIFSIFVIYSDVYYPIKALVISIFANTLYKVIEVYFTKDINEWFWSFKKVPDKKGFTIYLLSMFLIFGYCLFLI